MSHCTSPPQTLVAGAGPPVEPPAHRRHEADPHALRRSHCSTTHRQHVRTYRVVAPYNKSYSSWIFTSRSCVNLIPLVIHFTQQHGRRSVPQTPGWTPAASELLNAGVQVGEGVALVGKVETRKRCGKMCSSGEGTAPDMRAEPTLKPAVRGHSLSMRGISRSVAWLVLVRDYCL